MALSVGTRLGPYEIVGAIGAGGMGEVYKARDTRLDRTVAIKVLSPQLAEDPQFQERFEREARAISQLNHPNICTLHDIGKAEALGPHGSPLDFLVLEYLEGKTLATRLDHGRLELAEGLRIAREIADGLARAHQQGIVHRDLKPGNIMLTKSGAKLLDFGLAKSGVIGAVSGDAVTAERSRDVVTARGTILGTFQYMAPEQIEGGHADERSDIFALGTVLYEMLTGRKAFQGSSEAGVLSAILKDDPPPVSQFLELAPPALDSVVRACVAKDPDARVQSAHDLSLQLGWLAEGASAPGTRTSKSSLRASRTGALTSVAFLMVAALASTATWWLKPNRSERQLSVRFRSPLPETQTFTNVTRHVLAISPDGRKIAYTANRQLYLRELNQLEGTPIRGTAEGPSEPVFSPDSQWLAYFVPDSSPAGGYLVKRIPVGGGQPLTLARIAGPPFGVCWRNGIIAVGRAADGIEAISEAGGSPRTIVTVDAKTERAVQPQILEDGKHVIFGAPAPRQIGRSDAIGEGPIVLQAIDGGPRTTLVDMGANPHVLPTGHLAYVHDRSLVAVAFDTTRLKASGTPTVLVDDVAQTPNTAAGQFGISQTGSLMYVSGDLGSTARQLVWVDRQGHEGLSPVPIRSYQQPRLSPDGQRLVISSAANIWLWTFASETLMRLTNEIAFQYNPIWTPDGRYVLFDSNDGGGTIQIVRKAADGTGATTLVTAAPAGFPDSVSTDGKALIFHTLERVAMVVPLEAKAQARPLLPDVKGQVSDAEFSPDGRWLAYESNESSRFEVYVRPYPGLDTGRWQVSADGGQHPVWSRNGRELFFIAADGKLMSVPIVPGSTFTHGKPTALFAADQYYVNVARNYEVSPDGKRFLFVKNVPTTRPPTIAFITNWFDEVRSIAGRKD